MNNTIMTLENQPKFPQLLTLLLSGNESLEKISNNFFGQMPCCIGSQRNSYSAVAIVSLEFEESSNTMFRWLFFVERYLRSEWIG